MKVYLLFFIVAVIMMQFVNKAYATCSSNEDCQYDCRNEGGGRCHQGQSNSWCICKYGR